MPSAAASSRPRSRSPDLASARPLEVDPHGAASHLVRGVLHDVNNALNGVVISADLALARGDKRLVQKLQRVTAMLRDDAQLTELVADRGKWRLLVTYIERIGAAMEQQREEVADELRHLQRGLDHATALISAHQDAARDRAESPCEIGSVIDDVLHLTGCAAQQDIDIVIDDRSDGVELVANRRIVTQILVNLVLNAQAAVRMAEVASPRITVRCVVLGRTLRVEVKDNGVGIESSRLSSMFEPGFTTKVNGHGIGLHHSAMRARAIDGGLSGWSAGPGQGAVFVLQVPLGGASRGSVSAVRPAMRVDERTWTCHADGEGGRGSDDG